MACIRLCLLNEVDVLQNLPLVTLLCWSITYYKNLRFDFFWVIVSCYCFITWERNPTTVEPRLNKLSIFIGFHFWWADTFFTILKNTHTHILTQIHPLMSLCQWNCLEIKANQLAVFQIWGQALSGKLPLIKAWPFFCPTMAGGCKRDTWYLEKGNIKWLALGQTKLLHAINFFTFGSKLKSNLGGA